jgi:hypothetical protein
MAVLLLIRHIHPRFGFGLRGERCIYNARSNPF